jgi:hypothetical protein
MANLKVTIKIESTELFPSPVNQTSVHNLIVNGTFIGFTKLQLDTTPTKINQGAINGPSLSAYLYVMAPLTNLQTVFIKKGTDIEPFIKLLPGDFAFIPYGAQTSVEDLSAYTAGAGAASIHYFIAEKD